MNKKTIKAIISVIILCLIIGYMLGVYTTIMSVVEVSKGFVDVDYDLVKQAIFQYKNHVSGCYPDKFENALIHYDTWNQTGS